MLLLKMIVHPETHCRMAPAEAGAGHLSTLIREAEALARKLECGITFQFNTHTVDVWPHDDVEARTLAYLSRWEGGLTDATIAEVHQRCQP